MRLGKEQATGYVEDTETSHTGQAPVIPEPEPVSGEEEHATTAS